MRRLIAVVAILVGIGAGLALYAFAESRRDPVVRRTTVALPDWPAGAAPVTVALLADLHLGNASTDPARLTRVAERVTALHPDLIVIAGDMVFGHDRLRGARFADELSRPLARLRAPFGVVTVPGNHDHWTALPRVEAALSRAGAVVLANQAIRRGPLAIAGVDDEYSAHDRAATTIAAARRLGGAVIVVSHSPGVLRKLPRGAVLLAGHTHCGQAVLPIVGQVAPRVIVDQRLNCGVAQVDGRIAIVTAGIGTSGLPLRIGAPPDLWLVTLGPRGRGKGNRR